MYARACINVDWLAIERKGVRHAGSSRTMETYAMGKMNLRA